MHSILTELFYGNINPDTISIDDRPGYRKAMQLLVQNERDLLPLLNEESKCLFHRFSEAYAELNNLVALQNFSYGFRLGASLLAEVFTEQDTLISGID